MLCLCLNLTYANVVRFPRELDRHGVAFLLPYLLLFLLVGIPIILLEIALGQFLGQGSAHSWRASPIFRGKLIITHIALDQQQHIRTQTHTNTRVHVNSKPFRRRLESLIHSVRSTTQMGAQCF